MHRFSRGLGSAAYGGSEGGTRRQGLSNRPPKLKYQNEKNIFFDSGNKLHRCSRGLSSAAAGGREGGTTYQGASVPLNLNTKMKKIFFLIQEIICTGSAGGGAAYGGGEGEARRQSLGNRPPKLKYRNEKNIFFDLGNNLHRFSRGLGGAAYGGGEGEARRQGLSNRPPKLKYRNEKNIFFDSGNKLHRFSQGLGSGAVNTFSIPSDCPP